MRSKLLLFPSRIVAPLASIKVIPMPFLKHWKKVSQKRKKKIRLLKITSTLAQQALFYSLQATLSGRKQRTTTTYAFTGLKVRLKMWCTVKSPAHSYTARSAQLQLQHRSLTLSLSALRSHTSGSGSPGQNVAGQTPSAPSPTPAAYCTTYSSALWRVMTEPHSKNFVNTAQKNINLINMHVSKLVLLHARLKLWYKGCYMPQIEVWKRDFLYCEHRLLEEQDDSLEDEVYLHCLHGKQMSCDLSQLQICCLWQL